MPAGDHIEQLAAAFDSTVRIDPAPSARCPRTRLAELAGPLISTAGAIGASL